MLLALRCHVVDLFVVLSSPRSCSWPCPLPSLPLAGFGMSSCPVIVDLQSAENMQFVLVPGSAKSSSLRYQIAARYLEGCQLPFVDSEITGLMLGGKYSIVGSCLLPMEMLWLADSIVSMC